MFFARVNLNIENEQSINRKIIIILNKKKIKIIKECNPEYSTYTSNKTFTVEIVNKDHLNRKRKRKIGLNRRRNCDGIGLFRRSSVADLTLFFSFFYRFFRFLLNDLDW